MLRSIDYEPGHTHLEVGLHDTFGNVGSSQLSSTKESTSKTLVCSFRRWHTVKFDINVTLPSQPYSIHPTKSAVQRMTHSGHFVDLDLPDWAILVFDFPFDILSHV